MNTTPWVVRLTLDSSTKDAIKSAAKQDRRSAGGYLSKLIEEIHSGDKDSAREQVS